MAEDKDDSEEKKNEYFDDDEDFGLPDLEYDEIDEEDDEPLEEEIQSGQEEEPQQEEEKVEEPVAQETTSEESTSESLDIENDLEVSDDLDDIDIDDINLDEIDMDEVNREVESETEFYEEESFDEFEQDVAASDIFDVDNSATAGTSGGTEYSSTAARENKGRQFTYDESEEKRKAFTRIIVIGVISLVVIAVGFLVIQNNFGGGEKEPVASKNETPKPKPVTKKPAGNETKPASSNPSGTPANKSQTPASTPKQNATTQPKQSQPRTRPVQTTPGEVTRLNEKTGNTHIVIGSFIDEDLAMDYANELKNNGQSPVLIPPFDSHRYFRVAIASFGSFDEANNAISGYKGDYGDDIWTLRY